MNVAMRAIPYLMQHILVSTRVTSPAVRLGRREVPSIEGYGASADREPCDGAARLRVRCHKLNTL
jgi:hypothetical protein